MLEREWPKIYNFVVAQGQSMKTGTDTPTIDSQSRFSTSVILRNHLDHSMKLQIFHQQKAVIILWQRLHGTMSVWNQYKTGRKKPCVYTGPDGSSTDRICYLVPNGSTYESDPTWNSTVPVSNWSRVNRVDPYHSGSDSKRI